METINAKIGDIISFRYNGGRFVKGEVIFINNKCISLTLHTDYIGKNVDWYSGEEKDFNIKSIKKFNNWTNKQAN